MGTAPNAGQAIEMVLKLINAKKTIEIGVLTRRTTKVSSNYFSSRRLTRKEMKREINYRRY